MRCENPSTGMAINTSDAKMTGARHMIVENGLDVAGCRRSKIWVRDHLKPEEHDANMTSTNPSVLKAVSLATIMITPMVMVLMMATNLHEGCSSRKRNAKRRTKPRAEDLHMAAIQLAI